MTEPGLEQEAPLRQNASFWALVIFMLNFIPVVGSLLSVVFPALLVLVQFGSFGPFFASGPRRSRPPDRLTSGQRPVDPASFLGLPKRWTSPISDAIV